MAHTIPLWLAVDVKGLRAGAPGRGFIGKTRTCFVPDAINRMYIFTDPSIVTTTPPKPPAPTMPTVYQPPRGGWRSAGEVLALLGLCLLSGCQPINELRAAFGFGALFGAFVAVVVAAFIVRQREQAEGLDVSRALGAPGPRIRDALRR